MITYLEINEKFDYDPETGLIHKKSQRSCDVQKGNIAGCIRPDGYIVVSFKGKKLLSHRVAWILMTGKWPEQLIDHKNSIRSDNRWLNLRAANHSQNGANSQKRSINKSGFKGVYLHYSGKWHAQIKKDGKVSHIGAFNTPSEASLAYEKTAAIIHGEFMKI